MIRYKHPETGNEIITSNDGQPKAAHKGRKDVMITTADIERDASGKFYRKEGSKVNEK